MKNFKIVTFVACLVVFVPAQAQTRQDGNWWQANSVVIITAYIMGFWDGRLAETENWDSALLFSGPKEFDKKFLMFAATVEDRAAKARNLAPNMTVKQFRDGLDSFYTEYKNRLIPVREACDNVTYSIVGEPPEFIEKLTLHR